MLRSLSQTLTRLPNSLSSSPCVRGFARFRYRSYLRKNFSGEIPAEEVEKIALKNLEDVIHKIIVKRSQPDWIPLVPGSSYWVPPKSKAQGLAHVIGKLVKNSGTAIVKGKSLSLSYNRGWPSSAHFFKGASHSPLEGDTSKYTSQSEDEEG